MKRNPFQAVILDMDGVITQTARLHARAWKILFDEFLSRHAGPSQEPFDIDRDYRQYVDGKPRLEGIRSFLESRGILLPMGKETDGPEQQTMWGLGHRKNQMFHDLLHREGVELYEDTLEQIHHWKQQGLPIAVITSSRNGEAVLRAAGVLDLFDAQVDGNDLARWGLPGKPAPDMFLKAAQQLGASPQETIIVEDAIAGVEAGRAGGFGLVVGVSRNREGDDLKQAGADLVVRDLRELQDQNNAPPLSALEHFQDIADQLQGKNLALFLDYDGTLTPIVRRPEEATLSDEMRLLLTELAGHCTLAVVSGRDRRNVEQLVQIEQLIYAGSHGFDIRGPQGLHMQHEQAQNALPDLDAAESQLHSRIKVIEGPHVERKKFAIAVHYREVPGEEDVRRIEEAVDEIVAEHPTLRKRGGKKIFELQPDVEWDKGRAVLWITEALGINRPDVLVIYIGDDVTDEDAFRVLDQQGIGVGIRVAFPRAPTEALYDLRDCDEVKTFLQSLLALFPQQPLPSHD